MSLQDVTNKWNDVKALVPQRDATLRQEMIRQQNNERLRQQFAEKANAVGPWLERHNDLVASVGVQQSTLEQKLQKLRGHENEVAAYRHHMEDLERINQVLYAI